MITILSGGANATARLAAAAAIALIMTLGAAERAPASVLTFEIFDSDPFFLNGNYDNPTVSPYHSPAYGYPEAFRIAGNYGDYGHNVQSLETTQGAAGTVYRYGDGGEGFTPNVEAYYGPFSIFTGGPELWREGYGNLDGILYQASRHADPGNPIGNDYNHLDIILAAEPGWDVVLHGFDLGAFGGDHTISDVTVFDGGPNALFTPTNQIFEEFDVLVDGTTRTEFDEARFGGPLQSHLIWIRIDSSNLGSALSEFIGIDNIRFSQVVSSNNDAIDPAAISAALQVGEVPEATSLVIWLAGGGAALACVRGRRGKR